MRLKIYSIRLPTGTMESLREMFPGKNASEIVRAVLQRYISDRKFQLEEMAREKELRRNQ